MSKQSIPQRNIQTAKGYNRRPLTSKQQHGYVIYNGQSSQHHTLRLKHDASKETSSEQDTYRIQNAIFARKEQSQSNTYLKAINQQKQRATTAKLSAVTVDSKESIMRFADKADFGINTRSVQDLKMTNKVALYAKGKIEISEKAIDIQKQRAVSTIIKQAVKEEQESKLKLATQLNKLEKRKNQIVI